MGRRIQKPDFGGRCNPYIHAMIYHLSEQLQTLTYQQGTSKQGGRTKKLVRLQENRMLHLTEILSELEEEHDS